MPNKFRKDIKPFVSTDENDSSYNECIPIISKANVKVVEMTADEIKQIVEKAANEAKANANKKAAP